MSKLIYLLLTVHCRRLDVGVSNCVTMWFCGSMLVMMCLIMSQILVLTVHVIITKALPSRVRSAERTKPKTHFTAAQCHTGSGSPVHFSLVGPPSRHSQVDTSLAAIFLVPTTRVRSAVPRPGITPHANRSRGHPTPSSARHDHHHHHHQSSLALPPLSVPSPRRAAPRRMPGELESIEQRPARHSAFL